MNYEIFSYGNADALISTLDPCREADGTSSYADVTVAEVAGVDRLDNLVTVGKVLAALDP